MSSWNREGPSMVFLPRLPTLPGAGFTRIGLFWESNSAKRLHATFSVLVPVTPAQPGSLLCTKVGNTVGALPSSLTTLALGRTPRLSGVLFPEFCQIVFTPPAVIVSGAPEVQRKIEPN